MKLILVSSILLSLSPLIYAGMERNEHSAASVVERGQHHTVNEYVRTFEKDGHQEAVTNRYTVLATGLHRKVNGTLVEADATIELHPDGAVAERTQHKVKFLANIANWDGSIRVEIDGEHFVSRPLGISFQCSVTGQSVLIAELKDSVGTLFPPTKIIYQDAFTDFKADLEYNNLLSGLQQNLIFRESPPEPASFGLNNDTTYIELLTEFFESPESVKKTEMRAGVEDDRQLDFGSMKIGVGKSFMIGDETRSYSVQKQWTILNGRRFLIERVQYAKIAPLLNSLPLGGQAAVNQKGKLRLPVSKTLLLPQRQIANKSLPKSIEIARGPVSKTGFVIDYSMVTTSTDFTFKGNTTYYINNVVNLDGTTVFEAGAVLKYTNGGSLIISGPTIFKGTEYRPTVFTGKDDNTVGGNILGSTGAPIGNIYGNAYFVLMNTTSNDVRHIRMSYANLGIEFDNSGNGNSLRHSQFINCSKGLSHVFTVSHLKNILMFDVRTNFLGTESALHAEHLTVNRSSQLCFAEPGDSFPLRFTNSLLVAVTNIGTIDYNATNPNFFLFNDDPGAFTALGAASHYLPEDSKYRNAGTTSISPSLLADLKSKTTYAPTVIEPSGTFTNSLSLRQTIIRDTDIPDLGYHYDALDYAIGSMLLSNATMNVSAGTAVAVFASGTNDYGILLQKSAKLKFEGSPTNFVHFVRYNVVQEQSRTNWKNLQDSLISLPVETVSPAPEIGFRFTDFSCLDERIDVFRGTSGNAFSVPLFGCEVRGGTIFSAGPTLTITNCLFDRTTLELRFGSHHLYNSTFNGGLLYLRSGSQTATIRDNLFDHTAVIQTHTPIHNFNAYVSGEDRITPYGANDVIVGNISYEIGDLGSYYYPANSTLIDGGSRYATNASLYHFTTLTTSSKEADTKVDIGYHYAAVMSRASIDTDGDGLADYIEDANGNGSWDTGETKWQTNGVGDPKDTDADGVNDFVELLQGRSGTVHGTNSGAGLILHLYTPVR